MPSDAYDSSFVNNGPKWLGLMEGLFTYGVELQLRYTANDENFAAPRRSRTMARCCDGAVHDGEHVSFH